MANDPQQKRRLDIQQAGNTCRARVAEAFCDYSDEELGDFALDIANGDEIAYSSRFVDIKGLLESLAYTVLMGELQRRLEVRDLED